MGCKSMPFTGSGTGKSIFFSIDGELTASTVQEYQPKIIAAMKKDGAYILNFKSITECDLAGVQLITSFIQELVNRKRSYTIQESSPHIDTILKSCGVTFLPSIDPVNQENK